MISNNKNRNYILFLMICITQITFLILSFTIKCKTVYNTSITDDANNNTFLLSDSKNLYKLTKNSTIKILFTQAKVIVYANVGNYQKITNNQYYVIIYTTHKYLLNDTTTSVKVIYGSTKLIKIIF